jgi:hypothetical protein
MMTSASGVLIPGMVQIRSRKPRTGSIRLMTRVAFGFRSQEALIALAMLNLGGHRPALPAGNDPRISQESHSCQDPLGQ